MTAEAVAPLSIFYSYAHEDRALCDELDKHLGTLKRLGWIQSWHYRDIDAGAEWKQEIDSHLRTADLILLLVSADFLYSEYCYSMEMQEALKRHKAGDAVVLPIVLRPVNWQDTPLSLLQVLPTEGIPVTSWSNRDAAFVDVVSGIRAVVKARLKLVYVVSCSADEAFTQRLMDDLQKQGFRPFSSVGYTVAQGSIHEESVLRQMVRSSYATVLIASPQARYARSIREQLRIASMYQQPLVSVWAAGDSWSNARPSEIQDVAPIDARGQYYETACLEIFRRLLDHASALSMPHAVPIMPLEEPRNPFKGLHTFSSEDKEDFFGRDELIRELADTLQEIVDKEQQDLPCGRLLAVMGASGSGKSSVVMAGLLPYLQRGGVTNSDQWLYLPAMVPGPRPLEALALTLTKCLPARSVTSIQEDLRSDTARGLHLTASQIITRPETKVVLLVDQFEELFTLTSSQEEREQFIHLLIAASQEQHGPVVVLLTLRADFYVRFIAPYPELARLIQEHHRLVLPMTLKGLRAVIEQPAALPDVGIVFEGDLVGDLLFEVQGQAGALPLLQFTLDELFRRRSGHILTQQAYQELGGVRGALARHAESTYGSLPTEEHRAVARLLFLRLIDPGIGDQEVTKRRAALSEFVVPDSHRTTLFQEVIDRFVTARLLITSTVAGVPTIEISHETLIVEWARLSQWFHLSRSDMRLQKAITEDVTEWMQRGMPVDRLYWGTELTEAVDWARRNAPSVNEIAFLNASAVLRFQQEKREQARQKHEQELRRRTRRRQRTLVTAMAIMAVALVVSLIVGVIAADGKGPTQTPSAVLDNTLCPEIIATSVYGVVGNCAFLTSSGQLGGKNFPSPSYYLDPLTMVRGITDGLQVNLQNVPAPPAGKSYYLWLLPDQKILPNNQDYVVPLAPSIAPILLTNNLPVRSNVVHYTYPGDAQHNNLLGSVSRLLITQEDAGRTPYTPSTDHTTWKYYAQLPQEFIPGDPTRLRGIDHIRNLFYQELGSGDTPILARPGGLDIWVFRDTEKILAWSASARDAGESFSGDASTYQVIHDQFIRILDTLDGATNITMDVPGGTILVDDPNIVLTSLIPILGQSLGTLENNPPGDLAHMKLYLSELIKAPDASPGMYQLAQYIVDAINNLYNDKGNGWLQLVHSDAKKLFDMSPDELAQPSALSLLDDLVTQASYAYSGQTDQRGVVWMHHLMHYLTTFEDLQYGHVPKSLNFYGTR